MEKKLLKLMKLLCKKMNSISSNHIIKNFIALVISQYGGMVCVMFFSLWLTRLLSPNDFGIIAISLFYLTVFNWVTEWGWDQAFMAHKEIDLHKAASSHLALRFCLGSIPFFVFLLFKNVMSYELCKIVILLALIYWIERIGCTYKIILERAYHLQKIASLEFMATCLSYGFAVLAALKGFGVYSLVVQRFIEKGIITGGYIILSPWKIGFDVDRVVIKTFFKSMGFATWLGGIFGLAIYDFMPFLIGTIANVQQAGLYSKAFSLATFPLMLTGVFSRITTPLYTHYQESDADIKKVFVRAQTIKFFIITPFQLFLCISAPWWVVHVLGAHWAAMVGIYQVMCFYGFFRSFFDDVPNVLIYGFKNMWALTQSLIIQSMVILIVGPLCVLWFGALGGACAISCMMIVGVILFWRKVFSVIDCSWYDFYVCFRSMPMWMKDKGLIFTRSSIN